MNKHNLETLRDHVINGTYSDSNGNKFNIEVLREYLADRYSRGTKYRYHARVTSAATGESVIVSLSSVRENVSLFSKRIGIGKFNDWVEFHRGTDNHTPSGWRHAAVPKKSEDTLDIEIGVNREANITINIRQTFSGDPDDVVFEIEQIIEALQDAINEIQE